MAQYTRLEVVQQMKESGMVPLFYHKNINVAKAVLKLSWFLANLNFLSKPMPLQ